MMFPRLKIRTDHRPAHIQARRFHRFEGEVKTKNGFKRTGRFLDNPTLAAMERMDLYCAANPGSASAARRPQLLYRAQLWVALLGPSVEEGIVGIGQTVEGALRAFDAQYLAGLRSPSERLRRGFYNSKPTAAQVDGVIATGARSRRSPRESFLQ